MFSTDTLGWSNFTYQVTDEIIITLGTNFGYGKASYFRLGLSYKGIDILPYSYMVKYYYANRRDLLRYTRLYDVAHDSWNLAFSFVEKAANMASESAEEFVRHWILNEVEDMVHRLHGVLENPDDYIQDILNKTGEKADCDYFTVRNMYSNEKRRYGVFPEEMTMAIRSEKLTGALDFLGNLSALSATLPEIEAYIAEIKEMAVAIIPELDEMVKKLGLTSIIVADAGLGTINYVVLTVNYMRDKGLPVAGIIYNHCHKGSAFEDDNIFMCTHLTGVPEIARVSDGDTSLDCDAAKLMELYRE